MIGSVREELVVVWVDLGLSADFFFSARVRICYDVSRYWAHVHCNRRHVGVSTLWPMLCGVLGCMGFQERIQYTHG